MVRRMEKKGEGGVKGEEDRGGCMWEGWEVHVHCRRKRRREGGREEKKNGVERGKKGKQSNLV